MTRMLSIFTCIALGGALGALSRDGMMSLMHGEVGLPVFVSLGIVNVLGSLLIGIVFGHLEMSYNRREHSRLGDLPMPDRIEKEQWFANDPTIPAVDLFRMQSALQLASALLITGFLGAFTTFSAFCMLTVHQLQAGQVIEAVISVVGSIGLGLLTAWFGVHLGCRMARHRNRKASVS